MRRIGSRVRNPTRRTRSLGGREGSVRTSVAGELVLDGIDRVLGLLLQVVQRVLGFAGLLVELTLTFLVGIIGQVAGGLLDSAFGLIGLSAHVLSPVCGYRNCLPEALGVQPRTSVTLATADRPPWVIPRGGS